MNRLLFLLFSLGFFTAQAQINRPVVKDILEDGINISNDIDVKNDLEIDQSALSGAIANHTFGSGKKAITFNIVKENPSQTNLKTRELKSKRKVIDDYCAKDYFETSGTVSQWKVFDAEGNSDTRNIVPGMIYDLTNYDGTFFKSVENKDRNMIRISLTNTNQGTVQNAKVNNPRGIEKIRNKGVAPILDGIKSRVYGSNVVLASSFEESHSEQQLQIAAGGSVPFAGVDFDVNFSSNATEDKNVYYLELEEVYYSLKAAGKNINNNTFFKDANLKTSDYGYVSEVDYGRKIVVILETSADFSDKTFSSDVASKTFGKFENSVNTYKSNSNLFIDYKIYLCGGTRINSIPVVGNNVVFEDLMNDLNRLVNEGNTNAKDAVPIRFTLRDLEGNRIVSTYKPFESTIKSCNPIFQVILKKLLVTKVKDGTGESKLELYGDFKVKAYNDDRKQFYDTEVTELLENSVGPATGILKTQSGRTNIAEKDTPIKRKEAEMELFETEYSEGLKGRQFQIPNDAVEDGYFVINIDAYDRDKLSKDDELTGDEKVYFKDLTAEGIYQVTGSGKGNKIVFDFLIKRID